MARPQIDLGAKVEAEIAARAARGESARTIALAVGMPGQQRTIARRIDELKGRAKSSHPRPDQTPTQTRPDQAQIPDEIPETASKDDLNTWIRALEKALKKAELDGNLQAIASLAAKYATLASFKHKSAPLPKEDFDARPDFQKLAKEGEERLLTLVRGIFAT